MDGGARTNLEEIYDASSTFTMANVFLQRSRPTSSSSSSSSTSSSSSSSSSSHHHHHTATTPPWPLTLSASLWMEYIRQNRALLSSSIESLELAPPMSAVQGGPA